MAKRTHTKHKFIKKVLRDLDKRGYDINHSIMMGATGRGKFYLWSWITEIGLQLGKIKPYGVWIKDWNHLMEYLTFLFSSKEKETLFRNNGFRPRRFNVRIFIPISEKIPKYMPENLCIPFTMSIDNLSSNVIAMMCGKMEQNYYDEYMKVRYDGMNFTEFRKSVKESTARGYIIKKGFQNVEMISPQQANTVTMSHLLRRIGEFEDEGIISSTKDPYSLEKWLREEVKYQDTVVLLYTGFIKNENIRKILMIYFIETLQQIAGEQFNRNPDIPYKHQIHINEIESIVGISKDKDATNMDLVINKCIKVYASEFRHFNIEVCLDTKGITHLDPKVESMFRTRWFLGADGDLEIERICRNAPLTPKLLRNISDEWDNKGVYRFLDLKEFRPPIWDLKGRKQYGYELLRPRLCDKTKVKMIENDFRTMNRISTETYLNTRMMDVNKIQKELGERWKISETKWIKFERDKLQQKKEEAEKRISGRFDRVKTMQKIMEKNPDITNRELAEMLNVEIRTIFNDKHMLKKQKEKEEKEKIKVEVQT